MALGDLHEELFGVRFEEAHRAETDTMALLRVFKEMVYRGMIKYEY